MSYQLHLQVKLIAIKRIDCPHSAEFFGFTDSQIERGAKLFLEAKGIINPLIVKRTNNIYDGVEVEDATPDGRYEVRNGFLEYFCAVRGREIKPMQECVQAIILDNAIEENLIKQIELFRIGAETIEPNEFWNDDDPDFKLITDALTEVDEMVNIPQRRKSIGKSFAAAERLCNLYPDPLDRQRAIDELESLHESASGNRAHQEELDKFFAEAAGMYE